MGAKSAIRRSRERRGGALSDGVLEFINKARRALKMTPITELPRGVPEKSRLCVLARALKLEVLLDEEDAPFALIREYRKASMLARAWRVAKPEEAWNGWSVSLPAELTEFVHEFDARYHPELIMRDIRTQLRAAGTELREVRLRRREMRSLRLYTMRTHAQASVIVAEGREMYLRSMEICARARRLIRRDAADSADSRLIRRSPATLSGCPATQAAFQARSDLSAAFRNSVVIRVEPDAGTRPTGVSAAQV